MNTKTLEKALKITRIIDGEPLDDEPSEGAPLEIDGGIRIVVLQRGWVAVGRYIKRGSEVVIEKAKIIRSWGTSRGLGELVDGPTSSTKLDPAGTLRQHELAVITSIDCKGDAWLPHL